MHFTMPRKDGSCAGCGKPSAKGNHSECHKSFTHDPRRRSRAKVKPGRNDSFADYMGKNY
jgi:hypothetical protein